MNILLTGGAGGIGSHACVALNSQPGEDPAGIPNNLVDTCRDTWRRCSNRAPAQAGDRAAAPSPEAQ